MFRPMLTALVLALIPAAAPAQEGRYRGVEPRLIVDVRSPQEFAGGHVEGAVNIPHERLVDGAATLEGVDEDSPVLLYCRSGRRSALAAEALRRRGFTRVFDGGSRESVERELESSR